jgi:hypothetical protein
MAMWVASQTAAFATWIAEQTASVAESVALWAMYTGEWLASQAAGAASFIATQAAAFATWIAESAVSVASWVATQVAGFASAIASGAVWLAEHAVMTAAFLAQNIAMAASATAAFVAENLATLGIIAGIAALVAAIVYAATHWKQVWGAIKDVALDAWHWIDSDVLQPIGDFFVGVWQANLSAAETAWNALWSGIKWAVNEAWQYIQPIVKAISDAVGGISKAISTVNHVEGDVTGAIGSLGKHFATGGVVHSPMLAWVGDGNEDEYIIPKSKLTGMMAGSSSPLPRGIGGGGTTINSSPTFNITTTGSKADLQRVIDTALAQHTNDLVQMLSAGAR